MKHDKWAFHILSHVIFAHWPVVIGSFLLSACTAYFNIPLVDSARIEANNSIPVAYEQTLGVDKNVDRTITLTANSADMADALSFIIMSHPAHGTLSGRAPNLTFTPAHNFIGIDVFTFKVTNGAIDSDVVAITLLIGSNNHPPLAVGQNLSTGHDTPKTFTLSATDSDGDTLTYAIVRGPTHGTLSGTAPSLIYIPTSSYFGTDSFTFKVNDGNVDSDPQTISIIVNAAPSIAHNTPASSLGNSATPSFDITLSGGGNFNASDTISLYAQAACIGASVGSTTSVSTATAVVSASAQAQGSVTYSAKVTDAGGNTSCSSTHANIGLRTKVYEYDTTAPTITNVTSTTANGSYKEGDSIAFTITFSKAVTVNTAGGTPTLTLELGASDYDATCSATAESTTMNCSYTIQAGDTSSDLDYASTSALSLNGATIRDAALNNATLTLPTLGGADSIAGQKAIVIDTTAPTVPVIAMADSSSTPDTDSTPTFKVTLTGGINFSDGDLVKLYEGGNSTCNGTERDSATISGGSTTTQELTTDTALSNFSTLNYFAKISDIAGNSTCSSIAQSYTYRPHKPTSLTLSDPTGSPSNDTTPTLNVSGGSVQNTASVKIYSNSDCSTHIGTAVAASSDVDVTAAPALSPGSYLIYATVTINSIPSACSSTSAAYVLDTTPPAAPGIEFNVPASSPATDSTPSFTITLDGGGNFELSDTISLHAGANCSGASLNIDEASSGYSTASSTLTIAASAAQAEGTLTYRAKIKDAAGNETCSTAYSSGTLQGKVYLYDNTAPTWADSLNLGAATSISTTSTPSFTYASNASDGVNGSGISEYQYKIVIKDAGTCTASSTIEDWTAAPASGESVNGLSLNYGVHCLMMRAIDNVGFASLTREKEWTVQNPLSVGPRYTNATQWMDYVKSDTPGTATYTADNAACTGAEANRVDCRHGGEHLKVDYPVASCAGLSMTDNLGAFDWTCATNGPNISFYGALKTSKRLKDLINFTTPAFKTNFVILSGCGVECPRSSPSALWWANPVVALPNNDTTTGITLDNVDDDGAGTDAAFAEGTIFTLNTSRNTYGYSLNQKKMAIVLNDGVTLTHVGANDGAGCGTNITTICGVNDKDFLWIEATLSAGGAGAVGLLHEGDFGRIPFISTNGYSSRGVFVNFGDYNTIGAVITANTTGYGLYNQISHGNYYDSISSTSDGTGTYSLALNGSNYLEVGSVTSTDAKKSGPYFSLNNSTVGNITVQGDIGATTISIDNGATFLGGSNSSYGHVNVDSIGDANSDNGVYITDTANLAFASLTATRNTGSGVRINNSNGVTVSGNVVANNNTNSGFFVTNNTSNVTVYGNISTSNNASHGFAVTSNVTNLIISGTITTVANSIRGVWLEDLNNAIIGPIVNTNDLLVGTYINDTTNSTFSTITATGDIGGISTMINNGVNISIADGSTSNLSFGDITVMETGDTTSDQAFFIGSAPTNLKFSNITANNNSGKGVSIWNTGTHVSGRVTTNNNGQIGFHTHSNCTGSKFGDIDAASNTDWNVYLEGPSNSFGLVYTANSLTKGGIILTASASSNTIAEVVSFNNGDGSGDNGLHVNTSWNVFGRVTSSSNEGTGIHNQGNYNIFGQNTIVYNIVGISNPSDYSIFLNTISSYNSSNGMSIGANKYFNSIVNLAASNASAASAWGVYLNAPSGGMFSGVLMLGNNTTGNCGAPAGTFGLIDTSCTDSGSDGSNTYTGKASTAVLRTGIDLMNNSLVGAVGTNDSQNTTDTNGSATYSLSLDLFNFEHAFRTWGKDSGSGRCLSGTCRIWDWAIKHNDPHLLNRSGNGATLNNGTSLTTNGVLSEILGDSVGNDDGVCDSGELCKNSFTPASTCPLQVHGDQYAVSHKFTYATTYKAAANAYEAVEDDTDAIGNNNGVCEDNEICKPIAGDSTCDATETCVQIFLKNAYEIIGDYVEAIGIDGNEDGYCDAGETCAEEDSDSIGNNDGICETGEACRKFGDDDGLCEKGEACIYAPNLGAYQGHGNLNQCTFSNGTYINGVKIWGYEFNGR